MIIRPKMINELEQTFRKSFTEEFKRYVLMKYAEEPFPYEYSEQDLYENIRRDIRDYAQGNLDIAVKSPSECWQQEREYLQNRYTEQSFKVRELEDDILELEQVLAENCLERPKIAKRWVEEAAEPF